MASTSSRSNRFTAAANSFSSRHTGATLVDTPRLSNSAAMVRVNASIRGRAPAAVSS